MVSLLEADEDAQRQRSAAIKQEVLLRASAVGYDSLPELTGFEDDHVKRLIQARHYLRRSKVASLKPLLPLLLTLKGKPYRLHNYFAFEPFFRTRMAKFVVLKTGRQVSKCMDEEQKVRLANGDLIAAKHLKVGDKIRAYSHGSKFFVVRTVTKIWPTGIKPIWCVITQTGLKLRVTPDHRLLVRDSDNHLETYIQTKFIYRGDYLATCPQRNGAIIWERVLTVHPDGEGQTLDIETDGDHNFVMDRAVSHNSTSLAAQGVVFSNSIPFFSTLYVTPLFEMIRRFSHNYVRQFLESSPAKNLFTGTKQMNSVLQRNFKNGSAMYFSYAFLDAERTRGIPADKNVIDEVQEMNYDFLQIIHETLSGSDFGLVQYAGTPKSLDNSMEHIWQDSSQAEWLIKCHRGGCNYWNVPKLTHDLYDMIGPWHSGISEECPGVICAKCGKPLDPRRMGRWYHAYPERRWTFAGYHVPQIIMPMHYANHEKWDVLVGKMHGRRNTTPTTFLNEVCGESCDTGAKLVTETDLRNAACLPWRRRADEASKHNNEYYRRILAVDWGGGGGRLKNSAAKKGDEQRQRTSFTSLAVVGMKHNGQVDVLWGHRSVRTHDWEYEARLCIEAMQRFRCSHIAHDYSNAGEGRLVLLYQAGIPPNNIVNIRYHGVGHNIFNVHEPTDDNPHTWYSLDRSWSLVTTCLCLKYKLIRTFQYDHISKDEPGLLYDFLSLIEEKVDSRIGTDVYAIVRNPNTPDDFAHAVNYGASALWMMTGKWPDIAEAAKFKIPKSVLAHVHPVAHVDWDDM